MISVDFLLENDGFLQPARDFGGGSVWCQEGALCWVYPRSGLAGSLASRPGVRFPIKTTHFSIETTDSLLKRLI